MKILADHGLKILFGLKVLVLGFVLYQTDVIQFGEKAILAQGPSPQAQPVPTATGNPTLPSNPGPVVAQNDNSNIADETLVSNRKSYLEDLLELPKIDPSGLKKNEISRYLKILERKQQQAADRIKVLEQREANLRSIEESVDSKIKNLDEEIKFFDQTLQKEKQIGLKRLEQLIVFYQKMEPKKAAPIFENMDRDLVVALFKEIPKKQTMNILSLMNPQKSVELTEYFGRIRSGKEYELLTEINKSLRAEFQQCKGLPQQQESE